MQGFGILRLLRILLIALIAFLVLKWSTNTGVSTGPAPAAQEPPSATAGTGASRYPDFLPAEAIHTLEAIEAGGPFPYDRDGNVFMNREGLLPERPRDYYREFTVTTPGSRDRGARRIVSGGDPPEVYYYTDDHYRSFRRVEARR
jgi:ribonuclease T1